VKALFRGHRGEGRSVIGITSFLLLARARRSAQANSRKREVTTELMSRPGATLRTGQTYRIDVENPSPGVRPGQAHIQIAGEPKYVYNFNTGRFKGACLNRSRLN